VSDHPKRWVCVGAAFAGAVIATASHSAPTTPQKASLRPNVVVILTDDQDRRSLRVMGDTRRLLARRGVTFANAFATYPVCCPSRATFLTGRYAHNQASCRTTRRAAAIRLFGARLPPVGRCRCA
jgi:Sulfatase